MQHMDETITDKGSILSKSAKRRLKRQRAIQQANTNTNTKPTTNAAVSSSATPAVDTQEDGGDEEETTRKCSRQSFQHTSPHTTQSIQIASSSASSTTAISSSSDSVWTNLHTSLQSCNALILPLRNSIQRCYTASGSFLSCSSSEVHAALKKLRNFIRAASRAWNLQTEEQMTQKDMPNRQIGQTIMVNMIRMIECLNEVHQLLLELHLNTLQSILLSASTSPIMSTDEHSTSHADQATSNTSIAACASFLESSLMVKESPFRQCKRLMSRIIHSHKSAKLDNATANPSDSIHHQLIGLLTNESLSIDQEIVKYENLCSDASTAYDNMNTAAGPIRLPFSPAQRPMPSKLESTSFFDEIASLLSSSQLLISNREDCAMIEELCTALNDEDEKRWQELIVRFPTNSPLQLRFSFLRQMVVAVRKALQLNASQVHLYPFGSIVSGSATNNNSDVDVVIVFQRRVDTRMMVFEEFDTTQLAELKSAFRAMGLYVLAGQLNARSPVLLIRPSDFKFARASQSEPALTQPPCKVDVSAIHEDEYVVHDWYQQLLPAHMKSAALKSAITIAAPSSSTASSPQQFHPPPTYLKSVLLNRYFFYDSRVRRVYVLLRHWFVARELNDAAQHTLSSFSWSLALIYALQRTSPPVLPVLDVAQIFKQSTTSANDSAPTSSSSANHLSVTDLLFHFFSFYAHFEAQASIDISASITPLTSTLSASSQSNDAMQSRAPLLHDTSANRLRIIDPIEREENTARSMQAFHWERIRRECIRAMHVMIQPEQTSDQLYNSLMKPAKRPELVQQFSKKCSWPHHLHLLFD